MARRRYLLPLATALLVTPLLVSAVRMIFAIGGAYAPAHDYAVMAFDIRDVGHHAVLVGMKSRFGWFHPGPMLFYLLAVPYRALGSRAIGMQVGALAINAASIAGCLVVARRRGGTPAMLCAGLVLALLTRSLGGDQLRDPWMPYVAVLPVCLLVLLAWSLADGDAWCLPWAVLAASFAVQGEVGYTPVALGVLVWGTVALCVRSFRARRLDAQPTPLRRPFAVAAVVGLVAWLPPLYGQFLTSDHNLSRLVEYFARARRTAGWRLAWRIMNVQFGAKPEWLFGARLPGFGGLAPSSVGRAIPWVLVLAAGALVTAVLLRHRTLELLIATLAVTTACGLYAISEANGGVFAYTVRWSWIIGALWGFAVVWAAWLVVSAVATRAAAAAVAVAVLVGLTVVMCAESLQAVTIDGPQASVQPLVHSVASQVVDHLPPGSGSVVFAGSEGAQEEIGIALRLEQRGIPVRFADRLANAVPTRRAHGTRFRAVVRVVDSPDALSRPVGPDESVIARWPPVSSRRASGSKAAAPVQHIAVLLQPQP